MENTRIEIEIVLRNSKSNNILNSFEWTKENTVLKRSISKYSFLFCNNVWETTFLCGFGVGYIKSIQDYFS